MRQDIHVADFTVQPGSFMKGDGRAAPIRMSDDALSEHVNADTI
jgi:hypothetical protein